MTSSWRGETIVFFQKLPEYSELLSEGFLGPWMERREGDGSWGFWSGAKLGLCPVTQSVNNQVCLKSCRLLRGQENANKRGKYILVAKACGFALLLGDFSND